MHAAYFETHFCHDEDWSLPPDDFAIITGYATTGEEWSNAENLAADQALKQELQRRSVPHWRLTGYSPTTGHAEPAWAAVLSFEEACDLGQQFRQDAIYYIRQNELYVSYCDHRRQLILVGLFSPRLHSTRNDPRL